MSKDLDKLRDAVRKFAAERDWDQFHSPKNLVMALSVEASELLELFQWLTEEQSRNLAPEARAAAADEIADVLIYLIQLADRLDVDPLEAAKRKMVANAKKYPPDPTRSLDQKQAGS